MIQQGVLWAIVAFVAGLVWSAGRSFERLESLRREQEKIARELGELKGLLYTTIGGRRAIRPIHTADDHADDGGRQPSTE